MTNAEKVYLENLAEFWLADALLRGELNPEQEHIARAKGYGDFISDYNLLSKLEQEACLVKHKGALIKSVDELIAKDKAGVLRGAYVGVCACLEGHPENEITVAVPRDIVSHMPTRYTAIELIGKSYKAMKELRTTNMGLMCP